MRSIFRSICGSYCTTSYGDGVQADNGNSAQELPTGELVYQAPSSTRRLLTSIKLFLSRPWRKFKKGSVLVIEVHTDISELTIFCMSTYVPSLTCQTPGQSALTATIQLSICLSGCLHNPDTLVCMCCMLSFGKHTNLSWQTQPGAAQDSHKIVTYGMPADQWRCSRAEGWPLCASPEHTTGEGSLAEGCLRPPHQGHPPQSWVRVRWMGQITGSQMLFWIALLSRECCKHA